uniref:Uncharacterized protein n=1 Tax=Arundo donax TaxID=35708 RepID=A0A0A8YRK3_ARUDO
MQVQLLMPLQYVGLKHRVSLEKQWVPSRAFHLPLFQFHHSCARPSNMHHFS